MPVCCCYGVCSVMFGFNLVSLSIDRLHNNEQRQRTEMMRFESSIAISRVGALIDDAVSCIDRIEHELNSNEKTWNNKQTNNRTIAKLQTITPVAVEPDVLAAAAFAAGVDVVVDAVDVRARWVDGKTECKAREY
jgi:hypothetical protein